VKLNRRVVVSAIVFFCLGAALFLFGNRILYSLGAILVNAGPPQKADIAVVLAGDTKGYRILAAARLCRDGYVPKVLVSGPPGFYGYSQSDLEIAYAVRKGFPEDTLINFHDKALSTVEEAREIIPELRSLGVHSYLLVTSDYHTARATRIFRREGRDLEEHTVAASDPDWANGYWWTNREGRKLWFFEVSKTLADYLGI